ncbi:MAG: hypothetical protein R8P61_00600 [Bacteroidia bacterium]|nr:hypothetical protein [Bacteroidia bacterium]
MKKFKWMYFSLLIVLFSLPTLSFSQMVAPSSDSSIEWQSEGKPKKGKKKKKKEKKKAKKDKRKTSDSEEEQ